MRRCLLALATLLVAAPSAIAQGGAPYEDGSKGSDPSQPPSAAQPGPVAPPLEGRAVVARSGVNLRTRPGDGRILARLAPATALRVTCQRVGPVAPGRLGPSRVWNRVEDAGGRRGWVTDGLVATGGDALVAPLCAAPATVTPGAGSGACAVRPPAQLLAPFPDVEALIAAALPGARASQAQYRVPIAVTLAQGILETGGGRVSAGANNFFGLKAQATPDAGRYAFGTRAVGCVLRKTREAERGRLVVTIAAFRAYATLEDSILDHGERLATNPVYAPAFAHTNDPRRFATAIARRYATDPRYALKLLDLMTRYGLEARA